MGQRATISMSALKETFFVRKQTDTEHVLHLAELYEAGEKLPPLLTTREGDIVDGRHRYRALDLIGRKVVEVEYVTEVERGELLIRALKANTGGSLPPTREDINYTIRQLLEAGVTHSVIVERLPFPASLVRKHLASVKSGLNRDRQMKAIRDVNDHGMTVVQAAEANNVDPDAVREIISGNRRKKTSVAEINAGVTNAYRGRSRVLANIFTRTLKLYEDGDLTTAKVNEVFTHVEKAHKQAAKTVNDWVKRFEALKASPARR